MNEVYVYELKQYTENMDVMQVLARFAKWDLMKIQDFARVNDFMFYKNISREERDQIASELQRMGLITTFSLVDNHAYYIPRFKKIIHGGRRYRFDFNIAAFFFTWLWQLVQGLWAKMFIYAAIFYLVCGMILLLNLVHLGYLGLIFIPVFFIIPLTANYDFYLKKMKDEDLWLWLPYQRFKWIPWVALIIIIAVYAGLFFRAGKMIVDEGRNNIKAVNSAEEKSNIEKESAEMLCESSELLKNSNIVYTIKKTASDNEKMVEVVIPVPYGVNLTKSQMSEIEQKAIRITDEKIKGKYNVQSVKVNFVADTIEYGTTPYIPEEETAEKQ